MTKLDLQSSFNAEMQELTTLASGNKVAVAVSGGSDSMALALLAAEWGVAQGQEVVALSVDHGLRTSSAEEAQQVTDWLASRKIETHILQWKGPYSKTGIQAAAREARYSLMADFCRKRDFDTLLLGHQMEDQAETLLMRLSKGSGLDGLSSIQRSTQRGNIKLLRPLLKFERRQLREFLAERGQAWIEDPSNDNPKFTRTHLSPILNALQNLPGSEADALALSAKRLGRAANALNQIAEDRFQEFCQVSPFGFVRVSDLALRNCPEEIGLRLLSRSISTVSGQVGHIKLSSLEKLYDRCLLKNSSISETLSGCEVFKTGDDWVVCRETGREDLPEDSVGPHREFMWDGRYQVTDLMPGKALDEPLKVRRIGADGWRHLKNSGLSRTERNLPAKVRNTLPAIWSGDHLVAAPLFSCDLNHTAIAKGRFKMVFKPLITGEMAHIINHRPIGT
ncbi:MAG: tRNA lysidine(34) synthetase TilS [Proteobacteria bacterium]|nr:tRNA lysidine(34) synthetase TilS [Pseudomonadota bacterium]